MIYALNVYDIVPGREALYLDYASKASRHIADIDMSVVAAGHKPIREITGQSRDHFVLAQFANIDAFEALMTALANEDLHRMREEATANYIWTIYEPWTFGE